MIGRPLTKPTNTGMRQTGPGMQPQNRPLATPPAVPQPQMPQLNPMQAKPSFGDYPSYIYSPEQTNREINLQTALAQQRANLPNILEQFSGQGYSTQSPALYAQALRPLMDARVNDIDPRLRFSDSLANSQFNMQNQGMQHQDQMQNARMQEMLRQIQFGGQFGQYQDLVSLLGALLGRG